MSDESVDRTEDLLKKTGCIDLHHKVQECVFENKDWRKCQDVVKEFKSCMDKYSKSMKTKDSSSK